MPPSEAEPATRRRAHLPATIIFSARELKHYQRWQLQTQSFTSSSKLDRLPSALEYSAFKAWRVEQKRAAEIGLPDPFRWSEEFAAHINPTTESPPSLASRATIKCDPILHAAEAAKVTYDDECYPCIISAHITYMKMLTATLNNAGGPSLPPENASPEHELAFEAWYCGKLDLVKTVCKIQNNEEQTNTAQEALSMYWDTIENSTAAASDFTTSSGNCDDFGGVIKRRDSARVKKVGFAKDTNFNEGRSQAYFRKEGPRGRVTGSRETAQSEDDSGSVDDQDHETPEADKDATDKENVVDAEEATAVNDTPVFDDSDLEGDIIFEVDSDASLDEVEAEDAEDETDSDSDSDSDSGSEFDSDENEEEWDTPASDADCDDGLDASFIVFGE